MFKGMIIILLFLAAGCTAVAPPLITLEGVPARPQAVAANETIGQTFAVGGDAVSDVDVFLLAGVAAPLTLVVRADLDETVVLAQVTHPTSTATPLRFSLDPPVRSAGGTLYLELQSAAGWQALLADDAYAGGDGYRDGIVVDGDWLFALYAPTPAWGPNLGARLAADAPFFTLYGVLLSALLIGLGWLLREEGPVG